ncbi:dehydrogenase [Brachybacterium ginsengisoli]|uniref:Dehydrogenase n=1 Tax=Brachybacterium ginsengisoli TaxID=1331682 RepID=A0A291GV18_9MICO|nr:Gfo/Idh/MocA family oxidoreductase [Brachybacterium ginsengisoli]ATG54018.1 dehydrogenase [Brachybacterium ginsengisoli]
MPKTLNIAVIGAGTMAQAVHLPVLRRRWDRFSIAALVDHSPRRRRESSEVWGIEEDKRFETVADLVAAVRAKTITLDGVVLSTDGLHVEDLLALMRRGIPVLVEPPLGFSAEEIAEVADFERMTGRRLVMMAHPQQYDDSVTRMAEHIAVKDLRMVDHEILMPASQPLYGGAHVTTSSYDLPTEVRSSRRKALQAAVEAGAGGGATQRDRDLYVKGLLTGVAHQMAVTEATYGPIARLSAVRHWPKGVIPGSIELLGELEGGAQVRLVWHYLPFAPEYSETLQVLSARRRMRVELPAPSHGDERSTLSLREKKSGVVQETSTTAPKGSAELMWEAFHTFVEKGKEPVSGAAEALVQVELLREVLSSIVVADGRSLEAEESDGADADADAAAADGDETSGETADGTSVEDSAEESAPSAPVLTVEAPASVDARTEEPPVAEDAARADDSAGVEQTAPITAGAPEPAPVAEPVRDADEEIADAWGTGPAPTDPSASEAGAPDAPTGEGPRS